MKKNDLRRRLEDGLVVAPGAPDSLSARMVQQAGFPAVYMTGLGATAIRLGMPDIGLLSQTEMAEHARNMVRAVNIPVIADADNGYGGISNIERTVQEYEQAGVAAFHLEDQVNPKKCGQMAGIQLMPAADSAGRIKSAVAARQHEDLMVIGRTDALGVAGIDEALRRAESYLEAGADLAFVDGVKSLEHVEQISRRLDGPKVLAIVAGTEPERLTLSEVEELGFSMVLYPMDVLFSYLAAATATLEHLRSTGVSAGGPHPWHYGDFSDTVGLSHHQELERAFT